MGQAGWGWAPFVAAALGRPDAAPSSEALRVWKRLPEWEDAAPPPPPSSHAGGGGRGAARLAAMLGPDAEQRPGQADYAGAAAAAFAPRETRGDPHLVLAEAGTGTGKTLGYLAPASLWAEKNHGGVWISTFTRHLQRQIDAELARLFPDPAERRTRVVRPQGARELPVPAEPGGRGRRRRPRAGAGLGHPARPDRALGAGDRRRRHPGRRPARLAWPSCSAPATILGLADRRGECIHAACPHWRRCFVEHTIRRARTAELVVANHALVMTQAAWGGLDDSVVPTRYVFDEGHHVFDAADSAFAAELSGLETAELRRWLLGAEGGRSRARGLRRRIEELVAGPSALETPLDAALQAAARAACARLAQPHRRRTIPSWAAWTPAGPIPTEAFLRLVRQQVLARVPRRRRGRAGGALECDVFPLGAGRRRGGRPPRPRAGPHRRAARHAARAAARPRSRTRRRTWTPRRATASRPSAARSTAARWRRCSAWQTMLRALTETAAGAGRPARPCAVPAAGPAWRAAGEIDVGLHRHWLDPTIPFAATLAAPAHGLLVTSATLRDAGDADPETAWAVGRGAGRRAASAVAGDPRRGRQPVRLRRPDPRLRRHRRDRRRHRASSPPPIARCSWPRAAAALGLFTAIRRLRAVHARIAPELEAAGIPLYAQHVDAMGNATLVDIFRAEEESCLLGTDAMRDGVDVPGRALRLVVFERVPWPRPDILHRERRVHLSDGDPKGYDDRIARLRLRQAFGRLIRRATDRGVFVLLDRQTPSRLLSAFPAGVAIRRVGLAEAVKQTRAFLGESLPA